MRTAFGALRSQLLHRAGQRVDEPSPFDWCVRQGQRSGRRGFMRPGFGFMRPGFGALRSQLLHRAGQRVDEPSPFAQAQRPG